jgi:hypothetical protein
MQVLLDLQEECEKHGKVYEVKIPRPADPATSQQVFGSNNYGKASEACGDSENSAASRCWSCMYG